MTHPLQHVWVLWEHKSSTSVEGFGNSMREVCEFATVEEFWKFWCFVPKPSEVLFDGQSRKGKFNSHSCECRRYWYAFKRIVSSVSIQFYILKIFSCSVLSTLFNCVIGLSYCKLLHKTFTEVEGRNIEAFSIFKKGIRPEWEDIVNRTGGELTCRYHFRNWAMWSTLLQQ